MKHKVEMVTTQATRVGLIYRGYEIDQMPEGYSIKNAKGVVVGTEPTEALAKQWVNEAQRSVTSK
jgi:hypothetical protein